MAKGTFNAGRLYGSSSQVRDAFKEFRKGILIRDGRVGIIHAYKGLARRVHYSDALDTKSMTLTYIGEGRTGDQKLTRGNQALVDAKETARPSRSFSTVVTSSSPSAARPTSRRSICSPAGSGA